MGTVANIVFEMSANVSRLQADMQKAQSTVEATMSRIQSVAGAAKMALGALGVATTALGFMEMIRGTIQMQSALSELSERTGVTVEALSSLKGVAKLSGTDMDQVAQSMQKLAKAMAESGDGKGKPAEVFAALGVAVKTTTGELRPANEVMQELGKKLSGMKDQTLAVAFAQELMGKSGANLLPFLYDLARAGTLTAKVTTEQAEAAKNFEDNLVKLGSAANKLKIALANDMLPALNAITDAMVRAKKESGTWGAIIAAIQTGLTGNDDYKAMKEIVDLTGDLLQKEQARAKLGKQDTRGVILDKQIAEIKARLDVVRNFKKQLDDEEAAAKPKKDTVVAPPNPLGGDLDAVKSQYDSILRGLEARTLAMAGLNEAERVAYDLEQKRYGLLLPAQEKTLQAQAEAIDLIRKWQDNAKAQTAEMEKQRVEAEKMAEEKKKLGAQAEAEAESWRKVIEPARVYYQQLQQVADLVNSGRLTGEEGDRALEEINKRIAALQDVHKQTGKVDDVARQLGMTFTSAFEDAIVGGKGLRGVMQGLLMDIAKIAARKTITEPIAASLTGMFNGLDLGGLFGGEAPVQLAGPRAAGGPVSSGSTYLVGEKGPELFTPGMSGAIIPNDAMGGAGGSVSIVQHMTFGSDVDRATLSAWAEQVKRASVAAVADARRRGGSYASVLRG